MSTFETGPVRNYETERDESVAVMRGLMFATLFVVVFGGAVAALVCAVGALVG